MKKIIIKNKIKLKLKWSKTKVKVNYIQTRPNKHHYVIHYSVFSYQGSAALSRLFSGYRFVAFLHWFLELSIHLNDMIFYPIHTSVLFDIKTYGCNIFLLEDLMQLFILMSPQNL